MISFKQIYYFIISNTNKTKKKRKLSKLISRKKYHEKNQDLKVEEYKWILKVRKKEKSIRRRIKKEII